MGRSIENLSYLSSCSLSQRWGFQRIRSNILRDIQSDIAHSVPPQNKLFIRGETFLGKFMARGSVPQGWTNDQIMSR